MLRYENRIELTGNKLLLIASEIHKHQKAHHKYHCMTNKKNAEDSTQ
jgi:hypothetical protein